MNTLFVRSRSVVVLFAAASQFVWAVTATAEESGVAPKAEGPSLVAQTSQQPDAGPYELRYKLKRGDVLRYEVTHRASVQSTIEGTSQTAETKTDSVKVWKVTDVLPNGEMEFMNVVERVRMVNQLPDRKSAEYDSEKDETAPPGFEDAARSVGVPLSVVRIAPNGKVVRRDMKVRGQNIENDAPIVVMLPEKPVVLEESWDELFDVQVALEKGGTKVVQTRRHHKLTGVKNGIATIEVTYQVLSPMDSHIECQLVQRLMEGEVRFDIEEGRVVGQQMDIDRRVLGFAGPTSSMQYVMRMEEKLLTNEPKMASKSTTKAATKPAAKPVAKAAARPTTKPSSGVATKRPQPPQPPAPRTANGQRNVSETRNYRR